MVRPPTIRHVVTAGWPFIDIDAYAGIIAYAELLQCQGLNAVAASTAPLNTSVTTTIRSWGAPLERNLIPLPTDRYTLIDLSDERFFDRFVQSAQIERVIDHHPGHDAGWSKRLGSSAIIEPVGAACTLVYRAWEQAGLLENISPLSAKLLMCGILDNTLNFKAAICTPEDEQAYARLLPLSGLATDWPHHYFTECQNQILANLETALVSDAKTIAFPGFGRELRTGQLVVWDASQITSRQYEFMRQHFEAGHDNWFVNIIGIERGHNTIFTTVKPVQQWLAQRFGVSFRAGCADTDRLWLRKELIAHDLAAMKRSQII